MLTNFNLWTVSFIASFAFVVAALVILWSALREYFTAKNWRYLCFGSGLFMLAGTNLTLALFNPPKIISWSVILGALALELLILSLSDKNWHYALMAGPFLPLIIPKDSIVSPLAILAALPVSFLAYRNFCKLFCADAVKCKKQGNSKEGKEWGVTLVFLVLALAFYSSGKGIFGAEAREIYYGVGVIFEAAAVGMIYYHILNCINFSRSEKLLLPLMISFIVIFTTMGFIVNASVVNYLESTMKIYSLEEVRAAKSIAELKYSKTELVEKIKNKDQSLNDLSDEIMARTGIRITFFLGNERIAAAPSIMGTGRMIGAKIEDPEVKEEVLKKGDRYAGKIIKGENVAIAAYTPIYENDKVIGMIGTGKFIDGINDLQQKIVFRVTAGIVIVMIIAFGAIASTCPLKRRG